MSSGEHGRQHERAGARPTPTVAVCIPTLGRASLTDRCLPAVLAQLGPQDQVVVAFHGEPARAAAELPEDRRVATVVHTGETVSGVRNRAARSATADLLYFLDDDDVALDGGIDRLRALVDGPEVGYASGAMAVHRSDGSFERDVVPSDRGGLHRGMVGSFHAGTFVVRRSLFDRLGGYREALAFGENFDLGVRVAAEVRAGAVQARATDVPVLRWLRSDRDYDAQQADAVRHLLAAYGDDLRGQGAVAGDYYAILGVHAWRSGDRAAARRELRAAVRADPTNPRHWGRVAASLLGPIGDRVWAR